MKNFIIIFLLCSVGFAEQISGVTGIFKTKLDANNPLSSMLHDNITITVQNANDDDSGTKINFEIINNGKPFLEALNKKKCNSMSYSYNAEYQLKTSLQLIELGLAIDNGKCYTKRGFIIGSATNRGFIIEGANITSNAECVLTVEVFDRLKGKCRADNASAYAATMLACPKKWQGLCEPTKHTEFEITDDLKIVVTETDDEINNDLKVDEDREQFLIVKFFKNGNDECFKIFNSRGMTMLQGARFYNTTLKNIPNKNSSKKRLKDRIRFEVKEKE